MAKDGAPKSLPMPFHTIRRYQYSSFMTLKDVEDVEFYRPGGYHPVDIGDTIANGNDAYTVLHKLGHGGSSTHWLVKLQRPELSEAHLSFHALKIFSADALGDERADQEMKVLQRLGQVGRASHPSIPVLEDSFNICGPNGQHRCLVLPFFGPSVKRARFAHTLTPAQRHHICQQLASAVTFLHSHGICHGDLTRSNIVFEIPAMESMSESQILQLLGPIVDQSLRLRKGPVPRSKHAPKRIVAPASFSGLDPSTLTTIQINDLSCAFTSDIPPPTLGCPLIWFPAELVFGYPASTKSDVWQLAALIFYIYTDTAMFQVGIKVFYALIAFVVQWHGPLLSSWRGKFDWSHYLYGQIDPTKPPVTAPEPDCWFDGSLSTESFEDRIAEAASYLSPSQQHELRRLLVDMVALEPEKRISAAEADRHLRSPVIFEPVASEKSQEWKKRVHPVVLRE